MKLDAPPALRHRDFRLFWCGAVGSAIGTQFTTVAMAWQMYELTNSPLQIGLLGLGRAIPQIGLSLVGGVLADALDRRRLMMSLQLGQLAVSSSLAVLTFTGHISPLTLFVAAIALAFGSALETPPRQAIVPNLVPPADLSSAIALNNMQRSVGTVLGPSLAGVTLAASGPALCYSVDATSWLVMLVALTFVRVPWRGAVDSVRRFSREALLAGARFVLHQRVIFSFMVLDFGATFFGSSSALLPVFARDVLAVGPVGLGFMYAAPSIGAVITAAVMSMRPQVTQSGKWVLLGVALYGTCVMVFSASSMIWLALLALAGTGVGNTVSSVLRGTTNQTLTPDNLRGRVAAVNSAFVIGGPQLGQFESGVVAELWGVRAAAGTGGLGALLLAVGIALVPGVWRFKLGAGATVSQIAIQSKTDALPSVTPLSEGAGTATVEPLAERP